MADQIKVDASQLNANAETLKRDAAAMQDYLYQIYAAIKPHDPSNGGGDEVGKALGEQYFNNANQVLHASGVAALLLIDIANLAASGADNAAQIELLLTKINQDLSIGDAKLPSIVDAVNNATSGGSTPHTRR
ncbi:MAG TPA: hypothetical protein VFP72_15660 [Kineosporiaceae bacterium]|nr:hypothetical protein [Kineosporiaceae bacterium]